MSRALDDHMDREKHNKVNLVIHNVPEQERSSVMGRSQKDIALFLSMIKEVMRIHATSSKSFRAGKKTKRPTSHSQSVERYVKGVTEMSRVVFGLERYCALVFRFGQLEMQKAGQRP